MLMWLRRYLVALFVVAALAGGWLAFSQWRALQQIEQIVKNGQPVAALIEGAQSVERKTLLSYAVDLAWRSEDGEVLRAKQVRISPEFAEQIISNGQLVVPTVDIRYVKNDASQITAVAVDDADRQRARSKALGLTGLILALGGLIGALIVGINWFRRLSRSDTR